ncbi:MAG: hypothetical protein HOV71_25490 [Hamadaea sp.]|nr:hypothetical protein [Hamadaea sp.]NUR51493.1 hypothetical protein [Hamadaea sp.]NUT08372.1 hypothetical protein [Hamadaea sp.]
MRRIAGVAAAAALAATGLVGPAASAQAADACTLELSKYIYNGANMVMWSQGLSGCAGTVDTEVQSLCNGQWIVWSQWSEYYNNQTATYYGDVDYPNYMRVHVTFGTQEKYTQPAQNNNGGGDCL